MKDLRGCYPQFSLKERKAIAKGIKEESKQFDNEYQPVEVEKAQRGLDRNGMSQELLKAFRNRRFVVQIYQNGPWIRLSVNRSEYDPENDCWKEGISWDDLQQIKTDMGFGGHDAVEVFPKDSDIVYVTNMRHLWILPEDHSMDFIWRKK